MVLAAFLRLCRLSSSWLSLRGARESHACGGPGAPPARPGGGPGPPPPHPLDPRALVAIARLERMPVFDVVMRAWIVAFAALPPGKRSRSGLRLPTAASRSGLRPAKQRALLRSSRPRLRPLPAKPSSSRSPQTGASSSTSPAALAPCRSLLRRRACGSRPSTSRRPWSSGCASKPKSVGSTSTSSWAMAWPCLGPIAVATPPSRCFHPQLGVHHVVLEATDVRQVVGVRLGVLQAHQERRRALDDALVALEPLEVAGGPSHDGGVGERLEGRGRY